MHKLSAMENYLLDWANLLLRWVHVITAIAWIGSSFYFVFLDSSLTPPVDDGLKKQGVSGERAVIVERLMARDCRRLPTGPGGRARSAGGAPRIGGPANLPHPVLP